jgi:hypothetical protein
MLGGNKGDPTESIRTREDYLKQFAEPNLSEEHKKQAEALNYAHEIRRFEIELYWKRAAYFWTFIGAAFAAFLFVVNKQTGVPPELKLLVSCIGLVFSVAWFIANRGSKYWQDNWEQHVDLLEDEITGPLYKLNPSYPGKCNIWKLLECHPFSLSRINQVLNLFVIVIWLILVVWSLLPFDSVMSYFVIVATVCALCALIWKTETKRTDCIPIPINMSLRKRGNADKEQ